MTLGYTRKLWLTGRHSGHGEKVVIPARDTVSREVGEIYGVSLPKTEVSDEGTG